MASHGQMDTSSSSPHLQIRVAPSISLNLVQQRPPGSTEVVAVEMGLDLEALVLKSTGLSVSDHDSIVAINIFVALLCSCIVIGHLLEGNRWVLNQDETPLLYSLVFGEGVVNDATSVVLFNAIEDIDIANFDSLVLLAFIGNFLYLFLTSTLLGVAAGLLSAYIIKKLCFARHSTDREVAIMILMAYLSYMLSMLLDLSGILTVFFSGIVMSHYTWHNVTESSRITTKHTFATLSFIAEIFLFLYVGMDALDIEKWKLASSSPKKPIALSATILGLVMVGRAAFVFPLSFLSNLSKKETRPKISFKQQVIIWWAGLMRGAVSIALAYHKFTASGHTELRINAIMITSTVIVVLFSTMVFGILTKPLLNLLIPPRPDIAADLSSQSIIDPLIGSLLGFMRPMFGGRGFVPFVPGSPVERSTHGSQLGTVTEAENS
uniref:Cation/H+ exchanger transmembrane domain-containing protein n=1 Tax=Leersia perrieri TaxID=77586 RepID=A0A0D9WCT3_9ORYZ